MANRVLMGPLPGGGSGLRVSRPGYNVLDPALTGKQLAFDSRWLSTARVFMNGTVTLGVQAPVGGQLVYHTVNFGTTFGAVPPVVILQRDTSSSSWRAVDGSLNNTWLPSGGIFEPAKVFTNRIELSHPTFGSSRQYCYLIMRPL